MDRAPDTDDMAGRDAVYYLGRGVESMFILASETGIYWFLSMARERLPVQTTNPAEILAAMAPEFDDMFRAVTSATEELLRGIGGPGSHSLLRIMGTMNPLVCWAREALLSAIRVKPLIGPLMKFYARVTRRAGTDVRFGD